MKTIVGREDAVLRKKAAEIPPSDIPSPKIQKIIAEMKESLATQDDGVALAAPQIGESLQIFVVTDRIIDIMGDEKKQKSGKKMNLVYINPEIIKLSKDKKLLEEGCLSIRHWYGKIKRSSRASIRAYDEEGKMFERGGSGILAQIFQHETDHLKGILFIDNAVDLIDMPPEQMNERRENIKKLKKGKNV